MRLASKLRSVCVFHLGTLTFNCIFKSLLNRKFNFLDHFFMKTRLRGLNRFIVRRVSLEVLYIFIFYVSWRFFISSSLAR